MQPSWSPSGRRIAFWGLRNGSGQRDIWTIAADAKGEPVPVAVTSDPAMDWDPVWSPDGRSLYFASERGGSMNLWRVAIDEASGRPRGEPVARDDSLPDERLDQPLARRPPADVRELRPRSTIQRFGFDPVAGRVVEPPRPVFQGSRVIYTQDISPDGEWIAFSTLGVREDLFVVRSDGTGYRQITDDAFRDRGPKWSPDGTRIGFYSDRSGRYETWAIRPDGSGLEQQTKTTGPSRWDTEWSPDGKRLATTDGVQTWIEDLTQPLAERKAEPLPPLEVRPRPAAAVVVARRLARSPGTSSSTCRRAASRSSTRSPRAPTARCPRAGARRRGSATAAGCWWRSTTGSCSSTPGPAARARCSPSPRRASASRADDRWVTYIEPHSEADVWMATLEP